MIEKTLVLVMGLTLTPGINPMADSPKSSAQPLLSPSSGIALSVKQMETHSRKTGNDTYAVEYTIDANQYRDSGGRVCIESEIMDPHGNELRGRSISITDPVIGVQTILVSREKVAYRRKFPKLSGEAAMAFHDAADGHDSAHTWQVVQEDAGVQTIEGYSFVGTRFVASATDVPLRRRAVRTTFPWPAFRAANAG